MTMSRRSGPSARSNIAATASPGIATRRCGGSRRRPLAAMSWPNAGPERSTTAARALSLTAAGWYLKAALAGDATSAYQLGFFYEYGIGIDRDESEALRWYRQVAEAGHAAG